MNSNEPLLTPDDLSVMLKVPKSRVYQWSHEGKLPKIKPSKRCLRFRRSAIEKWLKQGEVKQVDYSEKLRIRAVAVSVSL